MKYWVDGCTSKKQQERGQLAINHFKGATFMGEKKALGEGRR
jgi:hypothetical protein